MKRVVLSSVALLMCMFTQAHGLNSRERIIFSVQCTGIVNKPIGIPTPKSPAQPPIVYVEDKVLYFNEDHAGYNLVIRDENGNDVYAATITPSETEVVLPSIFTGVYEIEMVCGNWVFTGWIAL